MVITKQVDMVQGQVVQGQVVQGQVVQGQAPRWRAIWEFRPAWWTSIFRLSRFLPPKRPKKVWGGEAVCLMSFPQESQGCHSIPAFVSPVLFSYQACFGHSLLLLWLCDVRKASASCHRYPRLFLFVVCLFVCLLICLFLYKTLLALKGNLLWNILSM